MHACLFWFIFICTCACRCKSLQERVNAGFESKAKVLEYLENKKGREAMVEDFRKLEKYWLGQARHSPADVHVPVRRHFRFFAAPLWQSRVKERGRQIPMIVPWLVENVGLGIKTYVYSFKGVPTDGFLQEFFARVCSIIICCV